MGYKPCEGMGGITPYNRRANIEIPLKPLRIKGTVEIGWYHIPVILLYLLAFFQCFITAGNPYQEMLAQQNELVEQAKEDAWDNFDKTELDADQEDPDLDGDGIPDVVLSTADAAREKKRKEREAEKDKAMEADPLAMFKGENGMFPDWLGDEEDDYDPDRPPLPSEFLPDFWPAFFLVVVFCLHMLVQLSQHWSVAIMCYLRYSPLPAGTLLQPGMYAKVDPEDDRGLVELCPVTGAKHQDEPCLFFVYQQQRYMIKESDEQVQLVEPDTAAPLADYNATQGLRDAALPGLTERFGLNTFEIPVPEFSELYLQQVARPMCVFQLFCTGLWLLDEAWNYALFGLFSILAMEATSVVSRLKHIKMIRGMGNKALAIQVYRNREWVSLSTEQLLPGDLVSMQTQEGAGGDCVPCDLLILRGNAVLNEATLTGESIPQMKEAMGEGDLDKLLELKGAHKMHIMYGGTSIIQYEAKAEGARAARDRTPDRGCLCVVLRTGFSSSQGKLVRMIEFSSSNNNRTAGDPAHLRESFLLIGLLLVFAIIASSYVMYHSIGTLDVNGKPKTRYQLLIRCIIIVTSVVPSDLPMQLALAVNASLMQLMKRAVFCTEPFRVPMAGKVDCAFFDKTGTITTDQMEAVGLLLPGGDGLRPLKEAPIDACRVIAGCHSLLEVAGKLAGDPIETAALTAIGWDYDHKTSTASPAFGPRGKDKEGKEEAGPETEAEKKRMEERQKRRAKLKEDWIQTRPWGEAKQKVRIIRRFHFESKLQRMSVIAASRPEGGQGASRLHVLVKGSPEAIGKLLAAAPEGYTQSYTTMVKEGMRVIALASRDITSEAAGMSDAELSRRPREWAEAGLTLVGFVAFQCLMRKDSKKILTSLIESNHWVSMITGDNMLTAVHVACEAGMTKPKEQVLILEKVLGKDQAEHAEAGLRWVNAHTDEPRPFELEALETLCKDYDVCVSGPTLQQLLARAGPAALAPRLHLIRVFARMTPDDKERVLGMLNNEGHTTLMCGDGANDVGALKAAHVGVALLGGFGSINTAGSGNAEADQKRLELEALEEEDADTLLAMGLFERIKYENERAAKLAAKGSEMTKLAKTATKEKKGEMNEKMMKRMKEETARLEAAGESFAQFKAMKNVIAAQQVEARSKVAKNGGGFTASAAAMALQADGGASALDGLEDGGMPLLKLGDASAAAPFTSKRPSIVSVQDIIRQGRCTLVSRVQNNQIICLTCLISSYSLSALYLEGVKFSDYQLTLSGMLLTFCHLALSYTSPLQRISAARPPDSMFHPALFLSLVGQFIIHLGCMLYAVQLAKAYMPELAPDAAPTMSYKKFTPNIINTVVFLVQTMQQVSVLMVNYKGRPFQPALTESKALLNALGMCGLGLLVCAYEIFPRFNKGIGMVLFPDDALRNTTLVLLLIDSLGTFTWDVLCVRLFAPDIYKASKMHFNSYSLFVTVRKLGMTCVALYLLVADGSLISLGVIFYLYRKGYF